MAMDVKVESLQSQLGDNPLDMLCQCRQGRLLEVVQTAAGEFHGSLQSIDCGLDVLHGVQGRLYGIETISDFCPDKVFSLVPNHFTKFLVLDEFL